MEEKVQSFSIWPLYLKFRGYTSGWFHNIKDWAWLSDNVMTRLSEVYGDLQLLLNMMSMSVADVAVVQLGLAMYGRRRDECIELRKFEVSLFVLYFSRSTLESPTKTNAWFSREIFSKVFAREAPLNSESSVYGCLYIKSATIISLFRVSSINVNSSS